MTAPNDWSLEIETKGLQELKDASNAEELRKYLTQASDKQLKALKPKDATSLKEFQTVLGTALRVMANSTLPKTAEVEIRKGPDEEKREGFKIHRALIGRKGEASALPAMGVVPE